MREKRESITWEYPNGAKAAHVDGITPPAGGQTASMMDSMPPPHRLADRFLLSLSATRRRGLRRPRRWIASPPNCLYIALSPMDRSVDL
uniref:Uncharacterized protein n=1 Tax=Oryza glumipatula TaxID=40148 RepID=A0A0E0ASZ7_9ORYZ